MQFLTKVGAALGALLASVSALASKQLEAIRGWSPPGLIPGEVGAVSVTYYTRGSGVTINGSTTAITAAQASQVQKQSAVVVFGVTGDVQALFTHNWGLDASAPAYLEPEVLVEFLSTALTTFRPLLTFDRTNTNVLAINKGSTADACTVRVTVRRPHSTGQ